MSDKTRRTVSIDEENDEFLSQQDNGSAVVNDLVTQYRKDGEGRDLAALKLRHDQKVSELESAREDVERLESDVREIRAMIEEYESATEGTLEDARDALASVPDDKLTVENPAVKHWAGETDMSPAALLKEIRG